MLGFGTLKKVRAAGYGIGDPLQKLGKNMTDRAAKMTASIPTGTTGPMASGSAAGMRARAGIMNTSGRAINAMGMRPGRTMGALALTGYAASRRPTAGNPRGMGLEKQLRQNTGYNNKMRSSAVGGLQPQSMGGYA
jgi:hypothetical protein